MTDLPEPVFPDPQPIPEADSVPVSTESSEATVVPPPDAPPAVKPRSKYERKEQAAADALRGLIRDYLMEKYPALMEKGEPLPLHLALVLVPGEPGELSFTPDLRRQLADQFAEAAAPDAEFREGTVFDFQTGGNDAPVCRPQDPTHVFAGYDSMGRPQWQAYSQLLLDQQDEEIDQLHRKQGRPVIRTQRGKDLKAAQLGSYGRASRDYALLGQLTAGYYTLPRAFVKTAGDERAAFTFQIVETRDAHRNFALRVNTLMGGLLPLEVNDLLQEPVFHNVARAREELCGELARLERKAAEARAKHDTEAFQKAMRGVPRLLSRFANALASEGKGARGRPQGRGGAQPAESKKESKTEWKADARDATSDIFFRDVERDSWVLLGESGFAHVFSREGRHITSFRAGPDLIETRIVSERWQGVSEADAPVLEAVRAAASGSA